MGKIRWKKLAEDTKKFFTSPVELYQNFEKEGNILEPIVYLILMLLIGEFILFLLSGLFHIGYISLNLLLYIFFVPTNLILFFIYTIILHFVWVLLGSNESFQTSLRCNASFYPLFPTFLLISSIPFFGKWFGFFIYFFALWYYIVLASIYVHNIDEEKAKKVFLIIFLIVAISRFINLVRWEVKEMIAKKKAEEMKKSFEENMKKWEEYEKKMLEQQQKMLEQQQNYQQRQDIPNQQ